MGKRNLEKSRKASVKHKKKKARSTSSSSSSSSSSCLTSDEDTKRKIKKKIKNLRNIEKLKKKKKERRERKNLKKLMKSKAKEILGEAKKNELPTESCDVDISLMKKSQSLAPMTKEEWEKQQNTFKRVFDEETGRTRLIKGTGEIVEECVSRERHLAINKQSTRGDGEFFQRKILEKIK